ncbi:MAG: DNA polymerase III subunit alpha, partial [Syntrophobacteraceae bacterium]|nr:DNA polymerase III subunit alpha [Syntrophobacteraceae bacterium]
LDGAIRLKDLINTAKSYNMPAVTMTDHGNMFGALEFYIMARKAGLKPIVGAEAYLAPRSRFDRQARAEGGQPHDAEDRSYHLVLLARNTTGYKNLMKLLSLAHIEGFYYKPRIDKEILGEHSEGLIGLSSCLKGEINSHLLRGQEESARKIARDYEEIFGKGNFYLELQANGIPRQTVANEALIAMGRELGIPLVATNDCHYLKRSDSRAHEILLCIQTGKTILDEKRMKFQTDQLYFKSPDEMAREFQHVPEALENTLAIADRCNLEIELDQYHFPLFPLDSGESLEDRFEKTVLEGFEKRLTQIRKKRPAFGGEELDEYRKRLRYELDVIRQMGFPAYFLIVADFINYAKNQGIPVGPGRGSAAGSLVAYVMNITDLDPIEHGLIFERFLNLERISMPDIDVDFCIHGRERVLQYVAERYGRDRVAQITTFGTMQARAVIRDVGRALAMPYNDVDRIAKLIPSSAKITLKDAFQMEPRLGELQREDPQLRELFEVAFALEGLTRHASTHAAGVVMADKPIVEYMPLYKGPADETVTQYSMKYVEKAGLIKFDFLGLRNLTVINNAVQLVSENHHIQLIIDDLPLDDQETYALLTRADTTGVFQLESSGMRDILIRLRPENFADIVALVALYRPGPLESGMVETYIQGKHGQIEVAYDLEELRSILEPTYGVILYQEQVMKIASVLANYTLGEADILRRAMGKKDPVVMAAQRDRFLSGAKENKHDLAKANHIFDLMEKFAGYGFNKSHSAAYALVAYQTAYLKAHFTVEFMA